MCSWVKAELQYFPDQLYLSLNGVNSSLFFRMLLLLQNIKCKMLAYKFMARLDEKFCFDKYNFEWQKELVKR